MMDEIPTLPEVAQLQKAAENTVYTMAQKGEPSAFRIRDLWRFQRADIDTWMASQVAKGSAKPSAKAKRSRS